MTHILLTVVCCLLAGSTSSYAQGKALAQKEASVVKGDDKGAAANNPRCKLFSTSEAGRYIGAPVTSTENNAMGFGCQWLAGDEKGDMVIAIVPAEYHEPPKRTQGYKLLPTVGIKGFVSPELAGWVAGSILGKQAIRVTLAGKGANEATAVELLKETMKRHAAQTAQASK